jgi:RNA polymerase sigma-70 factor, ECF subfamily
MDAVTRRRFDVHPDDQSRAARIAAGDDAAFCQLVRDYYPLAWDLACRLLGDRLDAEEVTQDAFLKVHRAMGAFRAEASLKTWILRIVLRLSLNRRRDRARSAWFRLGLHLAAPRPETEAPLEPVTPDSATPEAQLLAREARARILARIDQLPEGLRQVLLLNSLEQLSYEEIGRILDIPVGTVSSRLHAARKQLGQALDAEGLR